MGAARLVATPHRDELTPWWAATAVAPTECDPDDLLAHLARAQLEADMWLGTGAPDPIPPPTPVSRPRPARACRRPSPIPPHWQWFSLAALRQGNSVVHAARIAGIRTGAVYHRRKHNAEFAAAWDAAVQQRAAGTQ
jgi:hypothetical protein